MTTSNVASVAITNRDATPRVINNPGSAMAMLRSFVGYCVVANADAAPSTYRFGQVPSKAVIHGVKLSCPDIGTTTTMDIGLYDTTANGGAVVDADFFTAAVVLNAGAVDTKEVAFGNQITLAKSEQPLWQILGLATDPNKDYDITGTLVGTADAAGGVQIRATFAY